MTPKAANTALWGVHLQEDMSSRVNQPACGMRLSELDHLLHLPPVSVPSHKKPRTEQTTPTPAMDTHHNTFRHPRAKQFSLGMRLTDSNRGKGALLLICPQFFLAQEGSRLAPQDRILASCPVCGSWSLQVRRRSASSSTTRAPLPASLTAAAASQGWLEALGHCCC